MKNRVLVELCDKQYTITTDEPEIYVKALAGEVNKLINDTIYSNIRISKTDAILLICLDLYDKKAKLAETNDNMRKELTTYVDEIDKLKKKLSRYEQLIEEQMANAEQSDAYNNNNNIRNGRDERESINGRNNRDERDERDGRDERNARDGRDGRDIRDSGNGNGRSGRDNDDDVDEFKPDKEYQKKAEARDSRESRDSRDNIGNRSSRDNSDIRDVRDNADIDANEEKQTVRPVRRDYNSMPNREQDNKPESAVSTVGKNARSEGNKYRATEQQLASVESLKERWRKIERK